MSLRFLFILAAIAGAIVATIFFVLNNGNDLAYGLASLAISWGLFLITFLLVPVVPQQPVVRT